MAAPGSSSTGPAKGHVLAKPGNKTQNWPASSSICTNSAQRHPGLGRLVFRKARQNPASWQACASGRVPRQAEVWEGGKGRRARQSLWRRGRRQCLNRTHSGVRLRESCRAPHAGAAGTARAAGSMAPAQVTARTAQCAALHTFHSYVPLNTHFIKTANTSR